MPTETTPRPAATRPSSFDAAGNPLRWGFTAQAAFIRAGVPDHHAEVILASLRTPRPCGPRVDRDPCGTPAFDAPFAASLDRLVAAGFFAPVGDQVAPTDKGWDLRRAWGA